MGEDFNLKLDPKRIWRQAGYNYGTNKKVSDEDQELPRVVGAVDVLHLPRLVDSSGH